MSGNKNSGRKPTVNIWRDAIMLAARRPYPDAAQDGKKRPAIDIIADRLVQAAMLGDQMAIREFGDRTVGKPHQSLGVDGEGNLAALLEAAKVTLERKLAKFTAG